MEGTTAISEQGSILAERIALVVQTLIVNGYHLLNVNRGSSQSATLGFRKHDRLGGQCNYILLITAADAKPNVLTAFYGQAKRSACTAIVTGDFPTTNDGRYNISDFLGKLGGSVDQSKVLRSDLPDLLDAVGRNQPYGDLKGDSSDLLEEYVKDCLQHILSCPAHRFGQDRRFESVPDGVALGRSQLNIYYDAKAYGSGFDVRLDDVKRFASYIADFNGRYGSLLGPIFTFLVVSGHFVQQAEGLQNKSNQLYELCQTKMCFLTARDLGLIVGLFHGKGSMRNSVNWKSVFSQLVVSPDAVKDETQRIERDGLLSG